MVNEIDLQSKCVEAMREMGAFAQKCSNRFLIGVPDLLCQMPDHPTTYWEVKFKHVAHHKSEPTLKQKMWLRDFTLAGGVCGVIYFYMGNDLSFVIRPTKSFNYENIKTSWTVPVDDYLPVPRGSKFFPFKAELQRVLDATRK